MTFFAKIYVYQGSMTMLRIQRQCLEKRVVLVEEKRSVSTIKPHQSKRSPTSRPSPSAQQVLVMALSRLWAPDAACGQAQRGQQSAHPANYTCTANNTVLRVKSGTPETSFSLQSHTAELGATQETSLCEITYKIYIKALLKDRHLKCSCFWAS